MMLFVIITLAIHYLYRYWWIDLKFWPIGETIRNFEQGLSSVVYHQGSWLVTHILGLGFQKGANQSMIFDNRNYIIVNSSCSGFKQALQFILLFLIYPGPWKHKAWIIPLGVVLIHLTNLVRVVGLSLVMVKMPQYWDFSHDYIFRPLFYLVIFLLWVFWEERIRLRTSTK